MLNNIIALNQVLTDVKKSRPELAQLINKRMKSVLVSAYKHVPYYKELMLKAQYNPVVDFSGPEDLQLLPINNKAILKEESFENLIIEGEYKNLSKYFSDSTSGSTGEPFTIYRYPYERAVQIAKWLRVLFINGYSVRDKTFSIISPHRLGYGNSFLQYLGLFRRKVVDNNLSPAETIREIIAYKPDVVYGIASRFSLIAHELNMQDIRINNIKLLIAGGEVITESMREACREYMNVEITEMYGSVELGVMAYETRARDGLHLCEDLTYFEFVDDDGIPAKPGQICRVVMTDLMGKLMPFIRYELGDRVVYCEHKDKDGNAVRRIKRIIGRQDDFVVLKDGSRYPFTIFYDVLGNYTRIRQFRVIQKTYEIIHIQVVSDVEYYKTVKDKILDRLKEFFPKNVSITLLLVDKLEDDPSGKQRILISNVNNKGTI